jgi:DNA ligase-1
MKFYQAIINDPRGLPWSEGVVVKYKNAVDQWFKVRANDTVDVRVTRCLEGAGKFAGSLGAMVIEGPTRVESEVGSFQLTNEQRQWIWDHRDVLTGQIAEVRAINVNESGDIRSLSRPQIRQSATTRPFTRRHRAGGRVLGPD